MSRKKLHGGGGTAGVRHDQRDGEPREPIALRYRSALVARLRDSATAGGQTLTAEIHGRLERDLAEHPGPVARAEEG